MNTTTVWVIAGLAVLLLWLKGRRRDGVETANAAMTPQGEPIMEDLQVRPTNPKNSLNGMAQWLADRKKERGINGF